MDRLAGSSQLQHSPSPVSSALATKELLSVLVGDLRSVRQSINEIAERRGMGISLRRDARLDTVEVACGAVAKKLTSRHDRVEKEQRRVAQHIDGIQNHLTDLKSLHSGMVMLDDHALMQREAGWRDWWNRLTSSSYRRRCECATRDFGSPATVERVRKRLLDRDRSLMQEQSNLVRECAQLAEEVECIEACRQQIRNARQRADVQLVRPPFESETVIRRYERAFGNIYSTDVGAHVINRLLWDAVAFDTEKLTKAVVQALEARHGSDIFKKGGRVDRDEIEDLLRYIDRAQLEEYLNERYKHGRTYPQSQELYRGHAVSRGGLAQLRKWGRDTRIAVRPGRLWSCTPVESLAREYTGAIEATASSPVLLKISGKTAFRVPAAWQPVTEKSERLLAHCCMFRVVGVVPRSNGLYVVLLKELLTGFDQCQVFPMPH